MGHQGKRLLSVNKKGVELGRDKTRTRFAKYTKEISNLEGSWHPQSTLWPTDSISITDNHTSTGHPLP